MDIYRRNNLHRPSSHMYIFFVLQLGSLPAKWDSDANGDVQFALGMYRRFPGHFAKLHLHRTDLYVHVFGLGVLSVQQYSNADGHLELPRRVHGHPHNVSILHLYCSDVHFVHVLELRFLPVRRISVPDRYLELSFGLYRRQPVHIALLPDGKRGCVSQLSFFAARTVGRGCCARCYIFERELLYAIRRRQ